MDNIHLFMRYDRQEILIGKEGQKRLKDIHVCIVGLGALGSVSAELLARAGIGKITLIDRDDVQIDNLQRQLCYTEEDIGKLKAIALKEYLEKVNSSISLDAKPIDIDWKNISNCKSELILDGTDNFQTRFLINEYSRKNNIPWIYTGAIQQRGSLLAITPKEEYCFYCIFGEHYSKDTCDTAGILNSTSVFMASLQTNEAYNIILNKKYEKHLLNINMTNNSITRIKPARSIKCNVCRGKYDFLDGKREQPIIRQCGEDAWHIKREFDYEKEKKRLSSLSKTEEFSYYFVFKNMKFFKDNRIVVYTNAKEKAKSLIAQYLGE